MPTHAQEHDSIRTGHRGWRIAATALALALLAAACVPPEEDAVEGTEPRANDSAAQTTSEVETTSSTEAPAPDQVDAETTVPPSRAMVRSSGSQVLDPAGQVLDLRCVNVDGWLWPTAYLISDSGNALFISTTELVDRLDDVVGEDRADEFWKEWRDSFVTEADFERMAALGINCVRLVIYYRAILTMDDGIPVFDEESMAYIDSAIDWGEEHGVYIVLDLHSAPGGQNGVPTVADVPATDPVPRLWEGPDAKANQDATVAIWQDLAQRYAGEPWVAGYDLLNEPALPAGSGDALVDLYKRIILAIRSVDPDHMVILEGDNFAADVSVFAEPLDDNLMYEFHAYALTGFSEWATPDSEDLRPYLTLREEHDRPIWLGEFGEGTKEWIETMVDLAEAHDIGWALFPWKRKQTWFFNPVLQRIDDMPKWYALAAYLAQPAQGSIPLPSVAAAEEGMAEVLDKIQLANNAEDGALADAILRP